MKLNMKNQYSCIVPLYNERPRVIEVLSAISQVPVISEIICVDDGSTDGSYEEIRRRFPKITLLRHAQNKGKAQAVKTGLQHVFKENILLIDSDLLHLTHDDIERSIKLYELNNLDCLLLCTMPLFAIDVFLRTTIRLPHLMTGTRIIKTNDLMAIFKTTPICSYSLEIQENKYLLDNNKQVAYTNISALNVLKMRKVGVFQGACEDFSMWRQILTQVNMKEVLRQIRYFARRKLE